MAHLRKGNRDLIKEINRNLVLNLIKSRAPISRTEIARLSGLSPATISGIASDFIASGLVHQMGEGESTGGRRPVLLRLNHQAGFVVGVKLMEHAITSAVTDLDANVLYHRVTTLEHARDLPAVLEGIVRAIAMTIEESGVERAGVLGIGIGMAGVIGSKAGLCHYSPFFGWRDVKVAEPIETHFALPVYIDNDVNTLTIAEQWFGYGHGADDFVVVTVGRGIGAGIVVNGQFYRGALGGAGEFGHITLAREGPLCDCGKRGCLEALASDPAVLRMVRERIAAGEESVLGGLRALALEDVIHAAEDGDEIAREALADSGRWLGVGIANLVNILNPQLVIVAGEGVQAGEYRFQAMREAIRMHSFDGLAKELKIVIEPSGDETWARGAASLVLGEIFKHPLYRDERIDLVASMA